ncbi:MAG: glycosyltransferase family 2 protein [Desulfuromonadaceae bacterium]|nr:glycosyltransferase family 2 protein [Desulfuromonadaceae bacterium]MDD2854296.1 glycosyltransferase family 2 protein [Desulfuromonadaceae bacterium]
MSLISVCVPTYNQAKFLHKTIESVISQENVDFEILIIDDCSTDETFSIAEGYAKIDSRIRVYVNDKNLGMVNNWNRCIELANGEYIKFVFGDDFLNTPDALNKMLSVLTNEDVVLVATARHVINSDYSLLTTTSYFDTDIIAKGSDVINLSIYEHNNIIGEPSVVMFRKSLALRGFNAKYRQIVDLEMWFNLLENGKFAFIAEPLCTFRQHQEQQTSKNAQELAHIDDYHRLFDNYLKKEYILLSVIQKWFVFYYQLYYSWKYSRNGWYNAEITVKKIRLYCGLLRFYISLPLYKLYNPFFKLTRHSIRKRIMIK